MQVPTEEHIFFSLKRYLMQANFSTHKHRILIAISFQQDYAKANSPYKKQEFSFFLIWLVVVTLYLSSKSPLVRSTNTTH